MGIEIENLSPQLVDEYVAREKDFRCRTHREEFVQTVIRSGAMVGSRIDRFSHLTRGMDHASQLINDFENKDQSFPSGLVIAARQMSGGQGRFARYWHAPEGGLWMTLVLVNTLLPESARLLPLAVGVACCEAVRQYVPGAHLKWVNDVHIKNRKISGILTKTMVGPKHAEEYVLVGIGVNVNNQQFPTELAGLAQSITNITGTKINLAEFAASLLAKLVWNVGLINHFEESHLREAGFDPGPGGHPIVTAWQGMSDTIGRRVFFGHNVQENPQYEATVRKIMADGALLLDLADGSGEIVENSGELIYLD